MSGERPAGGGAISVTDGRCGPEHLRRRTEQSAVFALVSHLFAGCVPNIG